MGDVHRGIPEGARNRKRNQLSDVMIAVLQQHKGKFAYFQGFHDIALVFLEVGTPSQAFHMVERLALFKLSDQICCPFEQGLLPLLGMLFCLLEILCPAIADALREADCADLHFAVPWVLTWFSHSLPRLHQQVMRLFDCLLASHPAMIIYFAAALLSQHQDIILQTPREMPEMVSVLQQLQLDRLDVDDWASEAWQLAQRLPPDKFVRRLPRKRRCALPSTSPLFHFPHPWMPRHSWAGKWHGSSFRPITEKAAGSISQLAPVYASVGKVTLWKRLVGVHRSVAELVGKLFFEGGMAPFLRALGVGGVAAAVTWMLSFRLSLGPR